MIVKKIEAEGFKNLEGINIDPHPHYNLITGMNAQGKTNLMEVVWLMTGCRSFRGSKEKDFIGIEKKSMKIGISFDDGRRVQNISYAMSRDNIKEKFINLNGVDTKGKDKLFENFKCVVFTPDDIDIIRGGPDKRRSFIDLCSCQLKSSNLSTVKRYEALINQRNALLKTGERARDSIMVWDKQVSSIGTYLSQIRYKYAKLLNKSCSQLYSRITGGKEKLEITYSSNILGNKLEEEGNEEIDVMKYYKKLSDSLSDDIRLGYTMWGAHRDDFTIKINGLNIKDYGSQGQKKTAALVLKLAQAEIYFQNKEEAPVILLDDVMGELDENRQRLVFEVIKDMQVFITACNENAVKGLTVGEHFRVKNGKII